MDDEHHDIDPADPSDQGAEPKPSARRPDSTESSSATNGASGSDGQVEESSARSVLGSLPRTRPQRVSPRRSASAPKPTGAKLRGAASKPATEKAKPQERPAAAQGKSAVAGRATAQAKSAPRKTAAEQPSRPTASKGKGATRRAKPRAGTVADKPSSAKAKRPVAAPPSPLPPRPKAPKQGYEPEEEIELGRSVNPPSPIELVESVADIFIELAGASLKSGGRVLKDVLSPLRRG